MSDFDFDDEDFDEDEPQDLSELKEALARDSTSLSEALGICDRLIQLGPLALDYNLITESLFNKGLNLDNMTDWMTNNLRFLTAFADRMNTTPDVYPLLKRIHDISKTSSEWSAFINEVLYVICRAPRPYPIWLKQWKLELMEEALKNQNPSTLSNNHEMAELLNSRILLHCISAQKYEQAWEYLIMLMSSGRVTNLDGSLREPFNDYLQGLEILQPRHITLSAFLNSKLVVSDHIRELAELLASVRSMTDVSDLLAAFKKVISTREVDTLHKCLLRRVREKVRHLYIAQYCNLRKGQTRSLSQLALDLEEPKYLALPYLPKSVEVLGDVIQPFDRRHKAEMEALRRLTVLVDKWDTHAKWEVERSKAYGITSKARCQ